GHSRSGVASPRFEPVTWRHSRTRREGDSKSRSIPVWQNVTTVAAVVVPCYRYGRRSRGEQKERKPPSTAPTGEEGRPSETTTTRPPRMSQSKNRRGLQVPLRCGTYTLRSLGIETADGRCRSQGS